MQTSEELVEVVDQDGRVVSVVSRGEMRRQYLCHRTVVGLVAGGNERAARNRT